MTIIDGDLSDAQKRKILGGNARRLYRLEAGGPWS
jgi:predicted TIM-barrel fold metal-dependent hydrolase